MSNETQDREWQKGRSLAEKQMSQGHKGPKTVKGPGLFEGGYYSAAWPSRVNKV